MDWALRSCGWHGHETYNPDEDDLRQRLRVETVAGEAWRCLRCDDFVPGPPRRSGPTADAPEVPRGRMLRDRVIMRILAVERLFRAVFLALASVAVFRFSGDRSKVHDAFDNELPLLRPLASQIGWNIDDSKLVRLMERSFTLSHTALIWIGVAIAALAVSQVVEAVGLWSMQRWGEYFAVVVTSLFLPLEVYELSEKVTALKVVLLAVNIAAVVWLIWSKHLFGVRGGGAAYRAEHHAESRLTVERAAVSS
ncbi:DUF2127 domain-containing protein [Williamsia sterculiae]|uniref:Uncharacterized membrane protein, DUF2068 family n=1 Tax=Williamsia sterculiae TaxID=1344003 RepID=A0A1N7FKV2_9NOCA|nr:DUF2127 domain-containing protein [Williamsia sterculiae]SIS00920.1 Uncharacterized membrane protein, DUF2068 family [Williamsia sterculiae]